MGVLNPGEAGRSHVLNVLNKYQGQYTAEAIQEMKTVLVEMGLLQQEASDDDVKAKVRELTAFKR